ncbi:phosphoenolpyruvate--protein phosphotransferase [Nocardia mexicana]|uniref:Phosphocarrier protein HPr n=1 Tax=Nocardia mexicana TaxID=279262 RepID=A0A370H8T9_9NOCA|nr:phosphoenolpyruvate--protein phosphotransferase [Nocardia mexicana]RDI53088.1 phosphocarrier protein HPr /phosphoenolpyruvate--protein phosphotransferase /dihydroxyacetone kinase DhaM subunit [Nocardia mexicana]
MIGIVVVSHSFSLAQAAVALAGEMVRDRPVRIEVAAGLDEHTFGTDAVAVAEAIAAADSGAGVLVLMDLGSAVLSAELAVDLLESPHEVRLCAAPIVEGLVAAVVSAAGGVGLDEAAAEAADALSGKQSQLGEPAGVSSEALPGKQPREGADASPDAEPGDADLGAARATFVVTNAHGLHARPAARLVTELRGYDADVRLRNLSTGAGPVSGRSLSRIAGLGVRAGHDVEVTATGPDAQRAVDGLLALAEKRFGEYAAADRPPVEAPPAADRSGPYPASAGIGIGPAWQLSTPEYELPDRPDGPPAEERRRLDAAITKARATIRADADRAFRARDEATQGIFEAHLLLLDDDELSEAVGRRIADGQAAATAWATVLDSAAADLDRLPDEYQRARAQDLRAVRDQVLAGLLARGAEIRTRPGILVAADLTPAQVAGLDPELVTGIALAQGSPTAHSAIIARSRGIPAVVGAGPEVLEIPEGTTLVVDGGEGVLEIDPRPRVLDEFVARAAEREAWERSAADAATEPAITLDHSLVHVAANVGSVADAAAAVRAGADMAGLVRTEFLFLDRDRAPTVDEQEQVYREIATEFGGHPVTLRALDVGGDKPLPYLPTPVEANPFLGVRGIRFALARPDLLRDQLCAMARVAADHPVRVMLPMVTAVDEISASRAILEEVAPADLSIELGIMVEVPATAAKAAAFADHVDFFSIGTNDLTQYALAAERGNGALAALADPLDPGVLRLIEMTCRGAGETPVHVCGELAADPVAVPILLGLGVTELSIAPPAVPEIKATVRALDLTTCKSLAARALRCTSAAEVRRLA